jgi:thiamine biosynthesis lipoprotein
MTLFNGRMTLSWPICALWLLALATHLRAAPDTPLARYQYTEYHMGVDVRIVAYAPDRATAERACAAAFERFAELDTIMSDYRDDSELMRLCSRAGGPPVPVSKDLFSVLQQSQEVARRSEGAFDITCGPLVALWRRARKTHLLPAPEEIERARVLIGWQKLELDARKHTARLLMRGMKLDLGGIGKGYADDCAQQVLKRYGVTHALVEAGGDIVASGPPPGQVGWKVAVANAPTANASASRPPAPQPSTPYPIPVMLFANRAISTSGDTEQFVDIGGSRYSHIVDPRTGQALTDRIEVTILARDGLTSDGLSTAVSVLGPEKGQALVRTYSGVTAYIKRLARVQKRGAGG